MGKINVKLCVGTTCYVMGGADLLLLQEHLSDELKEEVQISGTPCLDYCFNQKEQKPPYAMVNENLISEASIEKVLAEINEQLYGSPDKIENDDWGN